MILWCLMLLLCVLLIVFGLQWRFACLEPNQRKCIHTKSAPKMHEILEATHMRHADFDFQENECNQKSYLFI